LVLRNGDVEDFRIQHTSGSSNAAIIENYSTVNGGIHFYNKGDGGYQFRTTDSNTLRMVIDNDGNVGIGTASSAYKLDINAGSSGVNITGPTQGNSGGPNNDPWAGLTLFRPGTLGETYSGDVALKVYRWATSGADPAMALDINMSSTQPYNRNTVATFRSNGNVGIGVANPSQKLDVNGTIYAPGSIVQVQSLYTTSSYSTTASSGNGEIPDAYNTGVKLSITPKKSTSKILVNFNFLIYLNGQTSANGGRCQIFRKINGANRTLVYGIASSAHDLHYYAASPSTDHIYINISFVDAPNTTGVCEYELASMMYTGGGTLYIGNGGNQPVTIQLMEIGA